MSKEILESIKFSDEMEKFFEEVISRTKGYDVYLGGGYIRDVYYNELKRLELIDTRTYKEHTLFVEPLSPKDIDLFFVPNNDKERVLPTLPKTYVNYDKSAKEIPDMEERGVNVRGLFVPYLNQTSEVQFITYSAPMFSEQYLAADMDCNINQAMYSLQDKTFSATEEFFEGHEWQKIEMLHEFDYIRMAKRVLRMKTKFPDYDIVGDWDFTDFVDSVDEHGGSFCE